jgi:ATP-binding cassette subfamily F protein uup
LALLSCRGLTIHFGDRALLDGAELQIDTGERIGFVGRNGEGKSTLLEVLAGALEVEEGTLVRSPGLRVSLLPQQVPPGLDGTVESLIRGGFPAGSGEDHEVQRLCSLLDLEGRQTFSSLSGGQKRRALLAMALAAEPDLLLLDEPTNHLDLGSIEWLEDFLARFQGSLLFITHDRTFLRSVATRILELDRGKLTSWACDYPTYVRRKEALLAEEERTWDLFDKKLAKEEEWIRQGIKARRTRNEGRVRALQQLREQRAQRRERVGTVRLNIQEAQRSGARVIEARRLGFGYEKTPIIRDLNTTVYRGDRVGIIGPNGCGKTTLLKLLLGNLLPDQGTVKHGIALEVAHFDQHREALDEGRTVAESVEMGSDFLVMDGKKRHVLSYLQDFLFSPDRAKEPISSLSGGERNRLLLARLFVRPSNLLVLDEPTNDLDIETLELLEARLMEYDGTILVVSHDRSFLDNLCTNTLVFEEPGVVREHVGGYSDWQRTVRSRTDGGVANEREESSKKGKKTQATSGKPKTSSKTDRLSYREAQEWAALPDKIEALEEELASLHEAMADPAFFKGDPEDIKEATARSEVLTTEIEVAYRRWAELDERA